MSPEPENPEGLELPSGAFSDPMGRPTDWVSDDLRQNPFSGEALWSPCLDDLHEVYLSARQQAKRKEVTWRKLSPQSQPKHLAAITREWTTISGLKPSTCLTQSKPEGSETPRSCRRAC